MAPSCDLHRASPPFSVHVSHRSQHLEYAPCSRIASPPRFSPSQPLRLQVVFGLPHPNSSFFFFILVPNSSLCCSCCCVPTLVYDQWASILSTSPLNDFIAVLSCSSTSPTSSSPSFIFQISCGHTSKARSSPPSISTLSFDCVLLAMILKLSVFFKLL